MTERFTEFSEFDAAAAGEALGAEPRTMRDIAHGDGEALEIGDTVLEVYRDAGFARVTTSDARVELYRVPRYTVSGERVVFEQGEEQDRSRLLVRNDGNVSFYPVLRATQSPTAPGTTQVGEQTTSPPSIPLDKATRPSVSTGTSRPDHREDGEQKVVQLQGRLGRDPWYSDAGDQPTAGFPLAVNDQTGKTTWHRVVVFGDIAAQVQAERTTGSIGKGRLVDVTGQAVVREEPTESGRVRKTTEFHATSVTRLTTTRTRPPR